MKSDVFAGSSSDQRLFLQRQLALFPKDGSVKDEMEVSISEFVAKDRHCAGPASLLSS